MLFSVMLLSASAVFAVSDENVAVNDNGGLVDEAVMEVDSDESVLSEPSVLETQSNVVNKDNFHDYFGNDGTLLDSVTSDELIFEGDFTGLDVNYMTIGKTIKLSGNGTALNNVSFIIGANNVVIDGFTLAHSDVFLFNIENVNGVTLSNNMINFKTLEGVDSYAIFANAVNDLKIINNTINYVGNTDGTVVNNAIRVTGDEGSAVASKNTVVEGNIMNIDIPSVNVGYDPTTYAAKTFSEGIVFYYCEGVKFVDNRLDLKYNKFSGDYDTVYALSVRGNPYNFADSIVCSNVEIINNTITAKGHNYIYSIYVSADDFKISNNVINSSADLYYANAINVDGPSSDGVVSNNVISINSPSAGYGIYSYQLYGAIKNISYVNNMIMVKSYAACGIEVVEASPYISNNYLVMDGNYTYGIVASIKNNGTISNNSISALGSNNGANSTGDPLLPLNSLGVSVKGNVLIEKNDIKSTGIGVNLVEKGRFTITDNKINVSAAGDVESYAIYSNVGNMTISNNDILFIGNTNGSFVNNAIRVNGNENKKIAAKNITVDNNNIVIGIPSSDVKYDPLTYEPTVYSEGIVLYYCEDVKFTNNRVNLKYNNISGSYDTIYVLSVRSNPYSFEFDEDYNLIYPIVSSDILISNNTINAEGHKYIYGVYVSADNFTLSDNFVDISSDDYYANGVNIDALSSNGVLKNNHIAVNAVNVVYGIYSASYMGPIENITYDSNNIEINAYAACGMELLEPNPYISNNTIMATGNYTYGIVASIKNNGTIVSNNIYTVGSEMGNSSTGDSLLPLNSLGISTKGNVLIKNNSVVTSGTGLKTLKGNVLVSGNDIRTTGDYAINATGSNLTVEKNYLASKKGVGANSIVSDGAVIATNNTPSLKTIIFAPSISTDYIKGVDFSVGVVDENGDPISNIVLFLTINGVVYNSTTDANGHAIFKLNPAAGIYNVVVSFNGDEVYGPKSVESSIAVAPSATKIVAKTSVSVYLTAVKSGSYYNIALKDANGKALANKKVSINFNGKTKTYTTNSSGVIKFKLSASKVGTYTLKMKFAGDNNFKASSLNAKIKITKQPTKLTAAKKTFKAKSKVKSYTVTLKDNKGKPIKKVKVTIKVKGKTYKAVTNSKGKATFKITKLTKKGSYTSVVKFAGNGYYSASSKSVKIVVKR